ncbi:MAG: crossover junction endodeoxyribonuclease RuvC [Chitinophagales bacterium]|nr:crossover junction endodeoxyribonuclease RuvC [Chitinophagales bacterium]
MVIFNDHSNIPFRMGYLSKKVKRIATVPTSANKDKIILGIDPGTNFLGYGLVKVCGKEASLIALGTVDLSKLEGHDQKLKRIYERVTYLIKEYQPTECAIEAPFYGKNIQSMLKLGRAQGVAIAAAITHELEVFEYAPRKIKQSITGNGSSSKEQVAAMLQHILKFTELPRYLDATDGLAVAMCHHFQNRISVKGEKQVSGWAAFVKANPGKVVKPAGN